MRCVRCGSIPKALSHKRKDNTTVPATSIQKNAILDQYLQFGGPIGSFTCHPKGRHLQGSWLVSPVQSVQSANGSHHLAPFLTTGGWQVRGGGGSRGTESPHNGATHPTTQDSVWSPRWLMPAPGPPSRGPGAPYRCNIFRAWPQEGVTESCPNLSPPGAWATLAAHYWPLLVYFVHGLSIFFHHPGRTADLKSWPGLSTRGGGAHFR